MYTANNWSGEPKNVLTFDGTTSRGTELALTFCDKNTNSSYFGPSANSFIGVRILPSCGTHIRRLEFSPLCSQSDRRKRRRRTYRPGSFLCKRNTFSFDYNYNARLTQAQKKAEDLNTKFERFFCNKIFWTKCHFGQMSVKMIHLLQPLPSSPLTLERTPFFSCSLGRTYTISYNRLLVLRPRNLPRPP